MSIRSLLLLVVMSAFLSGATSTCSEYRKEVIGPDALTYWAGEHARSRGCPGVERPAEIYPRIKQDVLNKINRYIDTYPQLPEIKKKQLRELTVHVGMTKEEVRLLLGEPSEILTTPETLQEMARDEWKDAEEAWTYRVIGPSCGLYYTSVLYLRADTITHIVKIITPIWWL